MAARPGKTATTTVSGNTPKTSGTPIVQHWVLDSQERDDGGRRNAKGHPRQEVAFGRKELLFGDVLFCPELSVTRRSFPRPSRLL
jgi:hypothetical protein